MARSVTKFLRVQLRAAVFALGLAACSIPEPAPQSPAPPPSLDAGPAPVRPNPTPRPPSAESEEMRRYFADVSARLLSQGLLRQDVRPSDAPYSEWQLAENFVRIALYDEYVTSGGRIVAREVPSRLRRWEQPLRVAIEFGPTIAPAQRARDRAAITAFAGRLGRLSGVPVSVAETDGADPRANFVVMVLNEDERRAAGPRLHALVPGVDPVSVNTVTALSTATFCLVFAFSEGEASTYHRAVAVIRGELPDLLRLSCIHEEMAQGMGLANDSPQARPSIFNDDEEFALMTRHDEKLMRILYDPRLSAGMREPEARPIVQIIAAELMAGDS